jgi:hypothetical protein
MIDLQQLIGSDFDITDNGNIVLARAEQAGQERVLRRLLSNPGSYYWHLEYGAGLARYLGKPLVEARIRGTILQQIQLEKAVSKIPPPKVTIQSYPDNTIVATVIYVDSETNLRSMLTVPIEGFTNG